MKLSSHSKYDIFHEKWRQSCNCKVLPNYISKCTVYSCKTVMFLQGRKVAKKLTYGGDVCCSKIADGEFSNPLIKGREFIFFSNYCFMRKSLPFSKQVTKPTFHYSRLRNFSQCSFSFLEPTSLPNDTYLLFPSKSHLRYIFFHYTSACLNPLSSFIFFFSCMLLIRLASLVLGLGLTGGLRCNRKRVVARNRAIWWR